MTDNSRRRVPRVGGPHRQVINSLATSITSLTPHLSASVACFVFWREICHPEFSDFCNTIGS